MKENEIEFYAALTHGLMAGGYLFTLPYWIKRKALLRLVIGLIGAGYHGWSVTQHLKELK